MHFDVNNIELTPHRWYFQNNLKFRFKFRWNIPSKTFEYWDLLSIVQGKTRQIGSCRNEYVEYLNFQRTRSMDPRIFWFSVKINIHITKVLRRETLVKDCNGDIYLWWNYIASKDWRVFIFLEASSFVMSLDRLTRSSRLITAVWSRYVR